MNVEKEINKIDGRIFNEDYGRFLEDWRREQEEDPYFGEITANHKRARGFLDQHLDGVQRNELAGLERLYGEREDYALRYSFSCELFVAFEQFFGGEDADSSTFRHLVVEGLMTIPGINRHISFHEKTDKCLAINKHLRKGLDHEGCEHLVSVELAWDERIYSTALASYYCGYRAGLSILEHIAPMKALHMTGHILQTEYELGLTTTFQQRERHSA